MWMVGPYFLDKILSQGKRSLKKKIKDFDCFSYQVVGANFSEVMTVVIVRLMI
jgi:hypothetical protein